MKKVGLIVREKIMEEIKAGVKDTTGCFFVAFNKVRAFPYNVLRNNLKGAGARVFVAKNSLFRKVFQELEWGNLGGFLEGETGVIFVYDKDVVKACKILVEFSKQSEVLKLKGGFVGKQKITSEQVSNLAKLPAKEVLLAMALRGLISPLTGFMGALNQIILKFVWAIEEIKKVKSEK